MTRLLALAAALAVLAFVLPGVAGPAAAQELTYGVEVTGVDDKELLQAIRASANLVSLADEAPPGAAGLIRRARRDIERARRALRSYGYYAGTVAIRIAGQPLDDPDLAVDLETRAAQEPVPVVIAVAPGPRYTIGKVGVAGAAPPLDIDLGAIGLAEGDPARASRVIGAEIRLVEQMLAQGFPFAAVASREVIVDHATRAMEVTYRLEPGPQASLGQVSFQGLERVEEDFLRRRIPFEPGAPYRPERIDALRGSLSELGVFSMVRLETPQQLTDEGRLPIVVNLEERERRFIGFGADFATSEGFSVRGFWGHRNLFGEAETLRLQAEVARLGENDLGEPEISFGANFRKPDFISLDQDLLSTLALINEDRDPFQRLALVGTLGLERAISEQLTVGAGISAEASEITDAATSTIEQFVLVGFPLTARLDRTDNLLDPTDGYRLNASATPYPFVKGPADPFLSVSAGGSTYYDLTDEGRYVLAARARVGSLFGNDETTDVPADKRFFAGGGGSIRGYDFQLVGPLTDDDDPIGGLSLFEAGLEARVKVTESIGLVPFVEAGNVFDTRLPSFNEDLQYGAGLGFRYFTAVGPVRVDFAVPLNPRDVDDDFEFYISLGQAF